MDIWPIIIGADSARAAQYAGREDQTEGSARTLLLGASVAASSARVTRFTWRGGTAVHHWRY